jgi:hypothetical protein
LALEYGKEKESCSDGKCWKSNYGLFSPRIHNEIEEMKLGLCDPKYCNVRRNPYIPPKNKNMSLPCPNTTGFIFPPSLYPSIKCTADLAQRGICSNIGSTILKYNPNTKEGAENQENAIKQLVFRRLCFLARKNVASGKFLDYDPNDSFLVGADTHYMECKLSANPGEQRKISVFIGTTTRNSVRIKSIEEGSASASSVHSSLYNSNENYGSMNSDCPLSNPFSIPGKLWGTYGIAIVNGRIKQKTWDATSCIGFPSGVSPNYATCSEVTTIKIRVPFKETNQDYIIDKSKEPVYVVQLVDNKFTPEDEYVPFHQLWKYEIDNSTCGVKENYSSNTCNVQDWECKSFAPADALPDIGQTSSGGCKYEP